MSDNAAIKKSEQIAAENNEKAKELGADIRAERTRDMRERISGLGSIKITSPARQDMNAAAQNEKAEEKELRGKQPADFDQEEETALVLSAISSDAPRLPGMSMGMQLLYALGGFLTITWIGFCAVYAIKSPQAMTFSPSEFGAFLGGMFAPPALFWIALSSFHRRSDVQQYAAALRGELQSLLFPSEETASLINKDIERLCRQAAEVSSASKAVLKSLHRARQGLRLEIRDFSGVSKKAEFHIDRLADSLKEKSSKLLTLTEEIEQRTTNIDEKTRAGADAWDQVTLSVLERAGEMEAAMGKGVAKILDAAEKAGDKTKDIEGALEKSYDSLNSAVEKVAERLEEMSGKFEGHKNGLSEVADYVSNETERLADMISSQAENLESVADRTVEAMTRSTETIQHHKEALDKGAEAVAEQSERIAGSITTSIEKLHSTVSDVIEKTEGLEGRLDEKTNALGSVIKGISKEADQIEEAGLHAANKLSEALSVAMTGSESISGAVQRAVDALGKSTQVSKDQAASLIEEVNRKINELNEAGRANADEIKSVAALLEQSRQQIENVTSQSTAHVTDLTKAVEEQKEQIHLCVVGLSERIADVRNSLSGPLKDVQSAVADADARHEMIENVLRRRVTDLNEASEKATVSAESIREILRGQAQEISTLAGQISGHARTINDQMTVQKNTLSQQVVESLDKVGKVTEALEHQSKKLEDVSKTAVGDITILREEIGDRCKEITEWTGKAFAELIHIDESLDGKITLIKQSADTAAQSVGDMKEMLEVTARDVEPIYLRAVEQADDAHKKLETLKAGFDASTESNLSRLRQIGIVFDERLQSLKDGSGEAASLLRTSSEQLSTSIAEIEAASKTASDKLRAMSGSIEDQSSNIHLLTDQAVLKVEAVQKVINEQFHELTASVGQAVTQLQSAGDEFMKQSRMMHDEAQKAEEGFERAGEKALGETTVLNEAAENTVRQTAEMVAAMKREADSLLEKAGDALFELKKSGDTFAIRAREVAEQMKASLNISESYGRELKNQATMIADTSMKSAEQIGKAVSVLTSRMDDVGQAANDVAGKVEGSRDKLSVEADRLLQVSSAALEAARDASITFGKQSESLFKASKDASAFAAKIRDSETRSQREAFLSSAKFIIESLHSLSVDVTRLMEGDVSEKTWKAFQKGDISAFTRKLVEMGDEWPLEKARDKFARDTEFRTYVQRYIRQFEEMFDQAMESDHGALLSSTIGSSEVAKLYHMLCTVAGKESKLENGALRAA